MMDVTHLRDKLLSGAYPPTTCKYIFFVATLPGIEKHDKSVKFNDFRLLPDGSELS